MSRKPKRFRTIDDVLKKIVKVTGYEPTEHDAQSIAVQNSRHVAFIDLLPRRGKSGDFIGVNVATVTLRGDCHTVSTFRFPGGRSWTEFSDEAVADFVERVAAFVGAYVQRLNAAEPTIDVNVLRCPGRCKT